MNTISSVRLLVGDPSGTSAYLTDDEITFLLTENGDVYSAAAAAADAIAAKLARQVDKRVGILSSSDSQAFQHYKDLAVRLRSQVTRRTALTGLPYAGGISEGDKEGREEDEDRVEPAFTRELHEFGEDEE